MTWVQEIAKLRKWAATEIKNVTTSLIGYTLVGKTSEMGDQDAMQKSDDQNDGQRPVQRIEPWGLRGRPPGKVRGLWLRLGSSNVAFIGIMPTKAYGPTDADDGETILYNATKAALALRKTGKVTLDSDQEAVAVASHGGNLTLDSDTGNGNDVVVNGGSAKVARVGDSVNGGTITAKDQITGNNILFIYTPVGGSAGSASTTLALTGGQITSGADHFKG